jgi:mannose-1-phosphate guanylyltransferase
MFDDCIIMAGGSGTRLWPVSSSKRPKQFLPITPEKKSAAKTKSFFSSAVERALAVTDKKDGRVIIIAGKKHIPLVIEACAPFKSEEKKRLVLISESEAKNTAPAIALGVLYAAGNPGSGKTGLPRPDERTILVLSSDHIIPLRAFKADARAAAGFARQDKLVVFGIPPVRAETGYGYVETAKSLHGGKTANAVSAAANSAAAKTRQAAANTGSTAATDSSAAKSSAGPEVFEVSSFREKPDKKTAEQFVAAKKFYWNSGMFAFSSTFMIDCFHKYADDVIKPFEKLAARPSFKVKQGLRVLEKWAGLEAAYKKTKAISFDYAIAEKCGATVMVKARFGWKDIGNWDEYAAFIGDSGAEVYRAGSSSCFVDSDIPVALVGVDGLIVAVHSGRDGPPLVLIVKKGESQKVREIVEQIKKAGRKDLL